MALDFQDTDTVVVHNYSYNLDCVEVHSIPYFGMSYADPKVTYADPKVTK